MLGCLKSLLGKAVTLLLLVMAAYAGWHWGPEVFPRVHEWMGFTGAEEVDGVFSSPELADSVMARIQSFRRGNGASRLALGGNELTSLLRYSVPGLIPDGVLNPEVRLEDGRVHLRAKVALGSFPDLPDMGSIIGMLPDTLDVALEAALMPFGNGTAALLVHHLEASRIPVPRRFIPDILTAMGRTNQPGLPPEALLVPLPSGLGSAYILSDSLILSNNP
jgi:hypothetical protein